MPRFKEKENMSSDDIPDDIIALFREKAQVRKFGNVVHGIHALEKKSEPKIVIAEIETYEEFLNEESILIDKSRTSSTSIESFEFSKEWSKKFNLEYERVSTNHSGSNLASSLESSIGFEATIKSEMKSGITSTIKSSVEETVKQKYCITEGVLYKRVEKTQISIPAYTKTRLIICWKNIWQKGIIEISEPSSPSSKVQIPFKVLVSVTFDRKQIDL